MGGDYYVIDNVTTTGNTEDGSGGIKPKFKLGTNFPKGSDTEFYAQGYVTIAPLLSDWTDHAQVKAVDAMHLSLP